MVPILATVTPAFSPGSTHPCYGSAPAYAGLHHRNEHLCDHVFIIILLTSALYLQDRDEIADDVIHHQAPKPLCESHHSVGNIITVPSGINPRATVASIQVLFRIIKASIHTRSALSHAHVFGILHYHECCIATMQGNLPDFQLNATARAAFVPDSALEFLPIFSSRNVRKCRYLVVFFTHRRGLALGNSLGTFRHKQDFYSGKHNLEILYNARMSYVH